jgi:rhodanese-related sulfurtransferase
MVIRGRSEYSRGVSGSGARHDDERGFVKVVEASFPHDKKIIVGCQAGPRSNAAAGLLQQAGYQDISNMLGGFGGMGDPMGTVSAPGWASAGLPVSEDNGEGVSYESLKLKVKK